MQSVSCLKILRRHHVSIPVTNRSVRGLHEAKKTDGVAVPQRMTSGLDGIANLNILFPRAAALECPHFLLAVAHRFDIDPGMGVDLTELRNLPFQVNDGF